MTNLLFTWNTKKTNNGFESIVCQLTPSDVELADGTFCKTERIDKATATFSSRDKAKRHAQKWVKYLRSINK